MKLQRISRLRYIIQEVFDVRIVLHILWTHNILARIQMHTVNPDNSADGKFSTVQRCQKNGIYKSSTAEF